MRRDERVRYLNVESRTSDQVRSAHRVER